MTQPDCVVPGAGSGNRVRRCFAGAGFTRRWHGAANETGPAEVAANCFDLTHQPRAPSTGEPGLRANSNVPRLNHAGRALS